MILTLKMAQSTPLKAPRLGWRPTYAFAVGELGSNLTWNMISGFILYYYSNVALLPVAQVGALLLVSRIMDAGADPLMGVIVDKTRSRFGRARPYLIFVGAPFAVMTVLTFSIPAWPTTAKLAYAFVTFLLVGLFYSALYVPYNAMVPLMTNSPADKLRLGGLRVIAASLGSILVFSLMMPLVDRLGGADKQLGFTLASAIMAIGSAVALGFVFFNCKERQQSAAVRLTEPVGPGLRDMFRNPVWIIATCFALAMFVRLGSLVSVSAFFAKDVLNRPEATSFLLSSLSVSILIGGLAARRFVTHFGKRRANLMALTLSLVFSAAQVLVLGNLWLFSLFYFIGNVSLGIQSATIFTMIADSVDAQELRFGSRNEGLLTSSASFAMKVGMAIGGSLIAYGLAAFNYGPIHTTASAIKGITTLYFGAPALCAVAQMVIISFYRTNMDQPAQFEEERS